MFGAVVLAGLALVLYQQGPHASWFPGCLFHRLTGLDCPSCGMTRAAHAVLHGRFGEAMRYNPLGMVVVPVLGVFVGMRIPAWLRGDTQSLGFRVSAGGVWWILGVVLGYWVLRNIRVWPFTLLASP